MSAIAGGSVPNFRRRPDLVVIDWLNSQRGCRVKVHLNGQTDKHHGRQSRIEETRLQVALNLHRMTKSDEHQRTNTTNKRTIGPIRLSVCLFRWSLTHRAGLRRRRCRSVGSMLDRVDWKCRTWNCKTWQILCHGMKTIKDRVIVAKVDSGYRVQW